jgi:lactoylglutathione lyase
MPDYTEKKAKASNKKGFSHLAISVGTKAMVDQLTEEIKKEGYKIIVEPRTTGDGYYESVIADPEGNLVEITVSH